MLLQSILKAEEKDSDAFRTIAEIIESRGFKFEEHRIETIDGYILKIHRIVNPNVLKSSSIKCRPVLLQHGFTGNSVHWLIASQDGHLTLEPQVECDGDAPDWPSSNLGFALAKNGYDVWLGNYRGNKYALEHKSMSCKDNEFWDFGLDDFIECDLPSTIDHVLKVTGSPTLGYVGHSQGNLTMFGLLASRPEYNTKISPFISLAPVTRISNIRTPLKHAIPILYALAG